MVAGLEALGPCLTIPAALTSSLAVLGRLTGLWVSGTTVFQLPVVVGHGNILDLEKKRETVRW